MTASRPRDDTIPAANRPGHHPDVEQDKPTGPPPTPTLSARFDFAREDALAAASRVVGVTDDNAFVEIEEDELHVSFGPWQLRTALDNVTGAETTGPYKWWKVAGPPHVSLADRGITFATSTQGGVCIHFREAVAAALPVGLVTHPSATVTVADAADLAATLERIAKRAARAKG
jgi:hypothetical protein